MSYFNCQVDGIQHRYPCEAHPTHPFNKNAKLRVQVKYSSTYENGGNGTSYFYGRLLALFSVSQSTMGVNQFCILFFFSHFVRHNRRAHTFRMHKTKGQREKLKKTKIINEDPSEMRTFNVVPSAVTTPHKVGRIN